MAWKTFETKTIFISCSADMKASVRVVKQVVDELNRALPVGERWRTYHWTDSDVTWPANETWQAYIPRTSDPRCGIVICLLGERIGEPLPAYFPAPDDIRYPTWLALPSEPDSAKIPLTGTLFELLDATLGPSREGQTFCYLKIDPDTFYDRNLRFDQRDYGFLHHHDALQGQALRLTVDRQRDYDRQVEWLDEFCQQFFIKAGRPHRPFGGRRLDAVACFDALRAQLRRDLADPMGVRTSRFAAFTPKGLQAYALDDAHALFGRDRAIETVLDQLSQLHAAESGAPAVTLTGRSGEGKSSLLRAGLAGRLQLKFYPKYGLFRPLLLEPSMFVSGDPLTRFCVEAEHALGGRLFPEEVELADFPDEKKIAKIADGVHRRLEGRQQDERLFVALDQAEEFIGLNACDGLIALLEQLAERRLAWVVCTAPLEDLSSFAKFAPALGRSQVRLMPPGDYEIREIIEKTVAALGLEAGPDEVAAIVDDSVRWVEQQEHAGPLLPLISALITEWAAALAEFHRLASLRQLTSLDHPPAPPTLDGILARLGEEAWREAGGDRRFGLGEALASMLRQLVTTGYSDGGYLRRLRNAPLGHNAFESARDLVRALRCKRLIFFPTPQLVRLTHVTILDGWARAASWYESDVAYQKTLLSIWPLANRWSGMTEKGQTAPLVADPETLDEMEMLWANWRRELEPAPIAFMRACLVQWMSPVHDKCWLRADGRSRLSMAMAIDDDALVARWIDYASDLAPAERLALVRYRAPITGGTALHNAAGWGRPDSVAWLLSEGAEVDAQNNEGWTALHGASWAGKAETVMRLLAHKSDSGVKTIGGLTALHVAARNGHDAVVALLLEHGAAIDVGDEEGSSPLTHAIVNQHHVVVRLLLGERADPNLADAERRTALHHAANHGDAVGADLLLTHRAVKEARDNRGYSALHIAAENGHVELAELLLQRGCDFEAIVGQAPDSQQTEGVRPLMLAASGGAGEIVASLLSTGADPNACNDKGETALHIAAMENKPAALRALAGSSQSLEAKARDGATPLIAAVRAGSLEACKALIALGARPDYRTRTNSTLLMVADQRTIPYLLELGADVAAVNDDGWTALLFAAQRNLASVALLVEAGADPNARSYRGVTALMVAASWAKVEIVEYLLEKGVDARARDVDGWTPLMFAVVTTSEPLCRLLRDAGGEAASADESAARVAELRANFGFDAQFIWHTRKEEQRAETVDSESFDEEPRVYQPGTVAWYDAEKGYGFVSCAGTNVFVHRSVIEKCGVSALKRGDRVDVVVSRKNGLRDSIRSIRLSVPDE